MKETLMSNTEILKEDAPEGYLDHILHQRFGLQCIGLDAVSRLTSSARCRLEEDPCVKSIQHETVLIENSEKCRNEIRSLLCSVSEPSCACRRPKASDIVNVSAVMIGLHCCGELMQDMMRLFSQIEELKAFVCVGCCYNKIDVKGFPMSQAAKLAVEVSQNAYPGWCPCTSGLRLGSHATRSQWADLSLEKLLHREKSIIYRAVLQCYLVNENIKWRKPKRRVKPTDLDEFEIYCERMLINHSVGIPAKEKEERLKKLEDIYSTKKHLFPRVKIFLILQLLLQPLWEGFVTVDRAFFFEENSISAEVLTVWDDSVSPRNIALCGYKR